MNRQPDIGKKADNALESLEGIQRAEPKPFFYTRLIGRMQRDEKTLWETTGSFLSKPVVVIASLCMILAFNAFILLRQDKVSDTISSITPGQQTESPVITDNEYILASSSSFEYENLDQQ
jgi:hypothetical protein